MEDDDEQDQSHPDVAIAGLDKGFEELDLGTGSDVVGGDHIKQAGDGAGGGGVQQSIDVDHIGKDPRDLDKGSDEQKDETGERGEGFDEEDPIYPYTLALFEYTVSQTPVSPALRLSLVDHKQPAHSYLDRLACLETTISRSSMAARTNGEGST
jgi:hypothetical protein